jgi:hypothetical protein
MRRRLLALTLCGIALAACGGVQSPAPPLPRSPAIDAASTPTGIPRAYRCLPSKLRAAMGAWFDPTIAYAYNCAVASAKEAANLQKLAIAMMYFSSSSGDYVEYCTGTPLTYDPKTRVGFVVTAAHCVVGGKKPAVSPITRRNITTFGPGDAAEVYQKTPGIVAAKSDLTGAIDAVYVTSQYCTGPAFNSKGACSDLTQQDGDVAVLKVRAYGGKSIGVNDRLQLAPAGLAMSPDALIMALGYGTNKSSIPPDPESRVLYYIDYQYFAKNRYAGVSSTLSLMNGYYKKSRYYSIICQGDSGGGDFYWDGTHWNLVGAHSWGPNPCGVRGASYTKAFDVSADLRPWNAWIRKIVASDTSPTGCAKLGTKYVCRAR